jgi:hypothetical protein
MGLAQPNEVLVSRTVKDLVAGAQIRFEDRSVHSPWGTGYLAPVRGVHLTGSWLEGHALDGSLPKPDRQPLRHPYSRSQNA